ncbi:formyltransferase family protein, partial [Candidatus Pelagibacter sp.]|nr:formyltransferase family protein [Candidatus Pelagibacter sp.]
MKILIAGRNILLEKTLLLLIKHFKKDEIAIFEPSIKLKILSKKNSIKVFSKNKKNQLSQVIKNFNPNIFLSCNYHKIIDKEIINKIPHPINIHFADLPKYKGFFSIPHAIRNDEKEIGISIHYMGQKVDSGKIITKRFLKNSIKLSAKDLHLRSVKISTIEILKIIRLIKNSKKIISKNQKNKGTF